MDPLTVAIASRSIAAAVGAALVDVGIQTLRERLAEVDADVAADAEAERARAGHALSGEVQSASEGRQVHTSPA